MQKLDCHSCGVEEVAQVFCLLLIQVVSLMHLALLSCSLRRSAASSSKLKRITGNLVMQAHSYSQCNHGTTQGHSCSHGKLQPEKERSEVQQPEKDRCVSSYSHCRYRMHG